MSYTELLRDPRWQRKRLEVMQRSDFACEECSDTTTTLNVHHTKYKKGRMPWEYEDAELLCLCEQCHAHRHGKAPPKERKRASRSLILKGGPADGTVLQSNATFPFVWVYEKSGEPLILAADAWKEVVVRGEKRASHFPTRGHPYMFSFMYREQMAELEASWKESPFPIFRGIYGDVPPGIVAKQATELLWDDPDCIVRRFDAITGLLGEDFDEAAEWE